MKEARLQALITRALCGGEQALAAQRCVLQTDRLERATQLLQDVPGVSMAAVPSLSPGAKTGTARLNFSVAEASEPLQAGITLDNQGVETTGLYRLGGSLSGNNPLGAGEAWSAAGSVTDEGMWVGALAGSAPVGERGFRVTGSATNQAYSVRAGGVALDGQARTGEIGLDYPFVRGLDRNIRGQLSALHTYATSEYPDFDISNHSRLNALRVSVQVDNGDRAQQQLLNSWSLSAALTAGQQSNNSPQDVGPQREGNYAKFSLSGSGTWYPVQSRMWFLHGRFSGQLASRNLDYSEKLTMGGTGAVRAFSSDEVSVDEGIVLNLGMYRRIRMMTDHLLQPGVFMDYGVGHINRHPWAYWEQGYFGIPEVNNVRSIAGYGLSLDWLTPFGVTASLTYARRAPFSEDSWTEPGSADNRVWFSLAYTF